MKKLNAMELLTASREARKALCREYHANAEPNEVAVQEWDKAYDKFVTNSAIVYIRKTPVRA